MFQVQPTHIADNTKPRLSNTDLGYSFCGATQPSLTYLVGIGQGVVTNGENLSASVNSSLIEQFIKQISPLLLQVDKHIGNDFIQRYLSKSADKMLKERGIFLDTIVQKVGDMSSITSLNPKLFKDLHNHTSLFTLLINTQDYSNNEYQLAISCDEPFFVYNIDDEDYPAFLNGWLNTYINFLASAIGADTISKSFLEQELDMEIERYECASEWSIEDIAGFKNYLAKKDISPEQQATIDCIRSDVINHSYDEESLDYVLKMLIERDELRSRPDDISLSFKQIKKGFIKIQEVSKSRCDKKSASFLCQSLIEQQLTVIEQFNNFGQTEDFIDNGDIPMAFNVIVDTHENLNHPAIDLNQIGESRCGYGEHASYSIDADSATALNSLKQFTVAEYFIWQLCNISAVIQSKD